MTRLLVALLLSVAWPVSATTIVALVSPRNAAEMLGGAHQFLDEHPDHQLVLRSTDQLMALDPATRHELLASADIVFAGGVFDSTAQWLLGQLEASTGDTDLSGRATSTPIASLIALHGDPRLSAASRLDGRPLLDRADMDLLMSEPPPESGVDTDSWVSVQLESHPAYREWLTARLFWSGRGSTNLAGLLSHLSALTGTPINVPTPVLKPSLRAFMNGRETLPDDIKLNDGQSWVAVLDHETGDRPGERDLRRVLCQRLEARGYGCLSLLADWGEASVEAMRLLNRHSPAIGAVVSLQDFVIGAGEGRATVDAELATLNVPVLKAIRLTDTTLAEWQLSEAGLPQDSVHYRVAMPELQGVSQPLVVSAMSPTSLDTRTGLELALPEPIETQIQLLERRVNRWLTLQVTPVNERKVAIVYYNHPPGRHNIGADNLNVPASLFEILQRLRSEGYNTGPLPETEAELLDLLQERGVNLPEDRTALEAMSSKVTQVDRETYLAWFEAFPDSLRSEMEEGPLGFLQTQMRRALELEAPAIGKALLERMMLDIQHAMEGADHPARSRVLDLLAQLKAHYTTMLDLSIPTSKADKGARLAEMNDLIAAIVNTNVEGLRGWGKPPGRVMVNDGGIILPGIRFGNVFIGPQPPRGWELNEELLHANLSFPPTHQYLAFYQWIRQSFQADAVVHLGRHSTLEFLPRHRAGLGNDDYPHALLGDLPNLYPYIVDGVGEGIQAKRRALAVMVDHLTPPLAATELYDKLLELRQLVESHEAAPASAGAMRARATKAIKAMVNELEMEEELVASMSGELEVRGITAFELIDDDLLVHEVGHYLTKLQEDFMPLGLHVFGRPWDAEAIDTMLRSIGSDKTSDDATAKSTEDSQWRAPLIASPDAEMHALLAGLSGRFIRPGKGNDPIRTPEVLPTGRNFFALDGGLVPSRLGHETGAELATQARAFTSEPAGTDVDDADAVVLWASDVVRDEGAMIAFGLDMLGISPVWSSRGIVRGLERLDIAELRENDRPRERHDTVFTTSGLFRDLYGEHLVLLEQAVLMALDASSKIIIQDYPALRVALDAALEPLADERNPGDEPLAINRVAARWTLDAATALREGRSPRDAGVGSAYRVFGDAPGTYGAGVNRLVERSGSWQERSEVAATYLRRMGHAYGEELHGEPRHTAFEHRLATIGNTYAGQSSNLYGLLDNNDMFDYLGGLSLAVEHVRGVVPQNHVLLHSDGNEVRVEPLEAALMSELRGRFLNPQWLVPLMDEGYAGARTMGSEFIEYLWGWQVTNPDIIKAWAWEEVKRVYIDDSLDLGLDAFLENGHNVHVKSNMLAVMLVAVQKGFWTADDSTVKQLAEQYVRLVIANGLPGSGHTAPDHPLHDWLEARIDPEAWLDLQAVLERSRMPVTPEATAGPTTIAEISLEVDANTDTKSAVSPQESTSSAEQTQPSERADSTPSTTERPINRYGPIVLGGLCLIFGLGWLRGARGPASVSATSKG